MATVYVLTSAMGVFDHLIAYESVAVHGLPPGFDVSHLELGESFNVEALCDLAR